MPRCQRTWGQRASSLLLSHRRTLTGSLLLLMLAGFMGAGVQMLQDPYRFPLRVVKVDGELKYLERDRVKAAVIPLIDGGFFTAGVSGIQQAVQALPWVYRVEVRRGWPDTLHVFITEQEPVARWGEAGYLNRFGEVFSPEDKVIDVALPQLFGPEGHGKLVLEEFGHMARRLQPLGLSVTELSLDDRRAWRLVLDNNLTLALGRTDKDRRLQRFINVFPVLFADRVENLGRVDLRYSNGLAAHWRTAGDAPVQTRS